MMDRAICKSLEICIVGVMLMTGCKNRVPVTEMASHSRIPVTVSTIQIGPMVNYLELNATSAFLFKAAVKSPVTGYIEKIFVNQGDAVEKDQLLFRLKTKEAMALMADSLNNIKFKGVVEVKAATAGIISSVEHSTGDYVAESDQLCQISIRESYAFILDVPFELSGTVKLNNECEIALPDSQVIKGIIKSRLPSMAGNSQTERYIVRLAKPKTLPENLTGKIKIIKELVKNAVSLPKSSILADETMQNYWVMKIINDSMAVKVPVTPGISTEKYVQVTSPVFKPSDSFLISGNYGLGDTVFIKILKSPGNGE
jgi:multidrug efflux pump subunit AcrA (membrane-fusion protein)